MRPAHGQDGRFEAPAGELVRGRGSGHARRLRPARRDEARSSLYRIGIDEVSWRKGHRYLTVVADHDRDGAVVWAGEGRGAATVERFFSELGPERTAALEAVSCDMSAGYLKAVGEHAPDARVAIDPFHVVKLANEAIDARRRWAWNEARHAGVDARRVKHTRWTLVKDPGQLSTDQRSPSSDCGGRGLCSTGHGC